MGALETPLLQGLAKVKTVPDLPIQHIFRVLRDPFFISKATGVSSGFGFAECLRILQVSLYLFAKGSLR